MIGKAIERGWRVALQAGDEAALKRADDLLWTFAPESFLPHGLAGDKDAERQPVVLTCGSENPNGAALRIFLAGAPVDLAADAAYARAILVFDGRVEEEVAGARRQWSALKARGFPLAYWQQSEEGRWEKVG